MGPRLPRYPRRLSAILMASALLAGSIQAATAASPTTEVDQSKLREADARPVQVGATISEDISKAAHKDGKVALIVKLKPASVAAYKGGVTGLSATNPQSHGQKTLNLKSSATTSYRSYLKVKQDAFVKGLNEKIKGAKVTGRFDLVLNGVSVIVPDDAVAAVSKLPGVAAVYPDVMQKVQTDTTPTFLGAPTIWSQLGGQESSGEGVIVGILDTGIWPEHPSFSDPDPSGKPYAAPPPPLAGTRACDFGSTTPGDVPFTCNHKLIGAERFMDTYDAFGPALDPAEFLSARDDDGHGTHTSSTAAGNAGVHASIFGIPRGTISGIAPRAYVEMFKVCGAEGCFTSDSMAATQAAIVDGVNVINFSIGGGAAPYSDAGELAFLDAYDAGVFVAASAGNSGPTPDTTDHRGPWVTTVAASTGPRAFVDTVHLTATGGATLDIKGVSLTVGVGPKALVVNPNPLCDAPAAPGTFTDKIVLCKRGNPVGRVADGYNVLQGGAAGMILYNQSAAVTDQETDNHFLPVSHVQNSAGVAILAFLSGHSGVTATISAGVKGTQQADVMASFSSRGGPGQSLGVSKPDITAPGVQILAGASPKHVPPPSGVALGPQGELFQSIAGTSMSSPHIAGSAALIKALHPTWTPGQIKSAIMTTASTAGLVKEDGHTKFTAFDAGSGRVNLAKAGNPGLTFDATGTDYTVWKDQLFRVNYPSVYHPNMPGIVSVDRTAHSVLGVKTTWKLTAKTNSSDFKITVPSTITVKGLSNKTFSIKMDAHLAPLGKTRFGTVTLTQVGGSHRVLHMPVTIVRGQADVELTKSCAPLRVPHNARTSCTITASNPTFGNATYNITDAVPSGRLNVIDSTVHGGTISGNTIHAHGTLLAAQPADVHTELCSTPCSGYVPLSGFGGTVTVDDASDESIANFDVPSYDFAGESWDTIGFVSNGYAVVGGGDGADVDFLNQHLPDSARPNNVLAPFWTDLNPGAGGTMSINVLTDGTDDWLVLEWDAVREFSSASKTHSFQIWIGLNTDTHPAEDITFGYGPNTGNGDGGLATVGAENKFGNRGDMVYADGAGHLPVLNDSVIVTSTPGTMMSKVITFQAKNVHRGSWTNCATLTSNAFLGTNYSCVSGRNLR